MIDDDYEDGNEDFEEGNDDDIIGEDSGILEQYSDVWLLWRVMENIIHR